MTPESHQEMQQQIDLLRGEVRGLRRAVIGFALFIILFSSLPENSRFKSGLMECIPYLAGLTAVALMTAWIVASLSPKRLK